MILILVPILLFTTSSALTRLTKLSPEQSLITIISSIIVIILSAGIFGALKFGIYTCYIIMLALHIYLIIALLKDKSKRIKLNIREYLTPGISIFMLSSIIYAIASWGSVLCCTDDAVHWAASTLYMLRTGKIFVGVQTLGVPLLNYFITSIAGYSEHALIAGRWMFIWAAFCLPLSNTKWDKWYKALIYAAMCYMICGTISTTPKVYMDLPLGVMAGAFCAYWAIEQRNIKRYIILCLGLLILSQIKNIVGTILAVLVLLFVILVEVISNRQKGIAPKGNVLAIFLSCLTIPIGIIMAAASRGRLSSIFGFLASKSQGNLSGGTDLFSLILVKTNLLMAVASVVLALVGALLLYIKLRSSKSRSIIKILIWTFFCLSAISLLAFLANSARIVLTSLSEDNQKFLFRYYNAFWEKGYWGKSIKMLVLMLIVFSSFSAFICLKKQYRLSFIAQSVSMVVFLLIYAAAIGLSYVYIFQPYERDIMAEFHRYLGTGVVFVMTWLTGFIAIRQDCWEKEKLHSLICSGAIILLLIDDAPAPGDTALAPLSESMLPFKYGIRPAISEHSQLLLDNTDPDDTIYVISLISDDNDETMCKLHEVFVRYEVTPRTVYWLRFDFLWDEFENTIRSGDIDYLYIHSTTDAFKEKYGYMFSADTMPENKALYRVDTEGDQLLTRIN